MDTQQEKKKPAVMSKYEKRKLCALTFIAAVLFVWATVSVATIIRFNNTEAIIDNAQAVIEHGPPQTTNNEIVEILMEIVYRLERLENR